MSGRLAGGCLCGACRYEVEDAFRYALICHCQQCRRATGAANKPFGGIEIGRLTDLSPPGAQLIHGDPAGAHDVRCRSCGSLLWSVVREGQWAHVAYGTLADAPSLTPQAHIFATSKAPWEVLPEDGLPRHAAYG
ncbi:GFA family protein [Wenxinia marina]|uniref:CENP-V/GFA domain-containing protein n=1 Tax=Wenxinia marina DSM 24838 TaxID=1123501 RepID=A0A0D0QJY2_9RHOB|nr:GFA family protein [Wenxinia marina]KIQ71318.1 hypothetical protein Wenmar_00087 [Wenxinia marina DSM 24838]GGL73852.1 aldehyde-activating protein [Wenxinia marina]